MVNNNKTIEELLRAGMSPDELTKMINETQKKIDKEKAEAKKKELEEKAREAKETAAREKLVDAYLDYFKALGTPDADSADLRKALDDILDGVAKNYKRSKEKKPSWTFEDFLYW